MRWFPNTLQWAIIWIAVLTSAHLWLDLRLSDFLPHGCEQHYGDCGWLWGEWGLTGYLARAMDHTHQQKLAFAILPMAALLVWQASGWGRKRK